MMDEEKRRQSDIHQNNLVKQHEKHMEKIPARHDANATDIPHLDHRNNNIIT